MSTIARLIEAFGTTSAMKTIERFIESFGSTVVTHEKTAVFRLPASRIWELVEGPEGLCQWDEQVVSMVPATPADEGPQHVGTRYRVRSWAGADGQINDRIEEVTGFDPPHLRRIQCKVPYMVFEVTTEVFPKGRLTLCRYSSRVELFGHMRLIKGVVKKFGDQNLVHALESLKKFVADESVATSAKSRALSYEEIGTR